MIRKYLLIGGIVLMLMVAAGGFYSWKQSTAAASTSTTRQTTTIAQGELTASVSGAGNITAPVTSNLSFGVGNVSVTSVNVNVGDFVKTGAVLAQAEGKQYEDALANAKVTLAGAQATLQELQTPATADELASAEAQVSAAQATYDAAVAKLKDLKAPDNALSLLAAQATLASAQENYKSALAKSQMTDQQIIVGRAALDTAQINLQAAQAAYNKIAWQDNATSSSAAKDLQTATIAYESAQATYQLTMAEMNNSELNSAKAALASAQSSLKTLTQGATAQDLASAQAAVDSAQQALLQAKTNEKTVRDGATQAELLNAQANVNTAQAAVDTAQRTLDSTKITAPFDGVIASVSTFVGQTTTANTTVVSLVDTTKLQTQVSLSEIDVAQIKTGQEVELSFDALGDGSYPGVVTAVSPVGTTTSGVVNYTVTIALTNPDPKILPGMTALANIITEKRADAIYVANRAVKTQGNRKTMTLLLEGREIPLTVQTGMTNSTFTEITGATMQDGTAVNLQEGDTVLLNTTTTSSSSAQGGFGGGPGGGILP